MTKIVLTILLASTLGGPKPPCRWQGAQPYGAQNPDVKLLISDLWSPDDAVRDSAKAGLVKVGPNAGPYLVSLIEEIRNHPKQHRFATGKEREGELFYQDPAAHAEMGKFVIDWRLVYDCVDVLGDLRYSEAAPIIIRVLTEREPCDLLETMGYEHYALVKIGEPAVPPLIDAIRNAASIAESIWGDGTDIRPCLSVANAEQLAGRIRQRAAMALRDIGDERAIPVLEDLLKPGQPFEYGNGYVQYALRVLRARPQNVGNLAAPVTTEEPVEARIPAVVSQLWSPDDSVRRAAKVALGKLGPIAEPYLVSLLSDIVDHFDNPHFATGKEPEGESYWRDPLGHVDFLDRFEITGRLALDCTELLGDVRSREAVPIIVRLMEQGRTLPAYESRGPVSLALLKIGEPAVLPLIEALNRAPSIAASICRERNQKVPDAGCSPEKLADRIRVTAVGALAAIGDRRALPTLEELLKPGAPQHNKAIDALIESAIGRIRAKSAG